MAIITIGIDRAKHVLAVHGVDETSKPMLVKPKVARADLLWLTFEHAMQYRLILGACIGPLTSSPQERGRPGRRRCGDKDALSADGAVDMLALRPVVLPKRRMIIEMQSVLWTAVALRKASNGISGRLASAGQTCRQLREGI